jgi:2-C-methyl-D-erythritol 4-phosphate cytidylyltransferase
MSVAALVLGAGRGERLGTHAPKAFVPLLGRPILLHALDALAACPELDRLLPVVPAEELATLARWRAELEAIPRLAAAVAGGAERQDSVRAGLRALPAEVAWVAVHDAARPLVRPADVARVVAVAREHGAALLAVRVRDTLKRVRGGRVVETPPRDECWAAQTPQVFRRDWLEEALAKAEADGFLGTDDAQLVERLGLPVRVVEGDPLNLKITFPEDLALAEATLRERRGPGGERP